MEAPPLRRLLRELESERIPPAAAVIGGAAYLEACYAIVHLLRSDVVNETGDGHGYSMSVILLAHQEHGQGDLTSVDLPVFRPRGPARTGGMIPSSLRDSTRWRLVLEPDRRVLPALPRRTAAVDLAVYESDKSYDGMRTSLPLLWAHPRPGGVLLVDDIDAHDAFLDVADRLSTGPIVIDKPFGTRLYDRPEARVGLLRKPGRDIGA